MLKIIYNIIFTTILFSSPFKYIDNLSKEQYNNLIWIYNQGKKYNLELTLTAIAWQESQFGKWKINLNDPSCGLFHNLLGSVADRLNITPNNWNQSRICERLIKDNYFALDQAIQELNYWKSYWKFRGVKRVWSHMVMSYNGGHKGNKIYLQKIIKKIRYLKRYFKWLKLHKKEK